MSSRHIHKMWAEACELLSQAERLQRQAFRPLASAGFATWEPPIDMFETDDGLFLTVALPGIDAERMEVYVSGGAVTISGMRPTPRLAQQALIHRMELPYGRFERRIALPSGHYELATHHLHLGCLQLNLRKL